MEKGKITVPQIQAMKVAGERISALTAYDFITARLLDQAGIELILVGDSCAMVFAGHETTIPITLDEMIYHTRVVRRGIKNALLVADMPFLSFQVSVEETLGHAGRFFKEAGAEAVKLEGSAPIILEAVQRLTEVGMPVMAHLGLTPQSIHQFGGFGLQAKTEAAARQLLKDAQALEQAGAFAVVLEKIPADLAQNVTESLRIPTIGIGAGPHCDGQILVTHDLLGLFEDFKPKFVRRYADLAVKMRDAFQRYRNDVKNGQFPTREESFS